MSDYVLSCFNKNFDFYDFTFESDFSAVGNYSFAIIYCPTLEMYIGKYFCDKICRKRKCRKEKLEDV